MAVAAAAAPQPRPPPRLRQLSAAAAAAAAVAAKSECLLKRTAVTDLRVSLSRANFGEEADFDVRSAVARLMDCRYKEVHW